MYRYFRDAGGKKYTWMGFFVAAVCFFLMSYYCVLQGYCLKYAVNSVTSAFKPNLSTETTSAMWTAFTDSQAQVIYSMRSDLHLHVSSFIRELQVELKNSVK